MKKYHIDEMKNGWFVGNFEPTIIKTTDFESAIKKYKAGDYENSHHHKIATEITVIVSGKVLMNNVEYNAGDIIVIDPNESTDFKAITDSINVVIKFPGANNDKYIDIEID